jgi:hypothetical protein
MGGYETKTAGAHRAVGLAAQIAELAYKKWQARGCPGDDDQRDWFEAEREVRAGRAVPEPRVSAPSRPPKGSQGNPRS